MNKVFYIFLLILISLTKGFGQKDEKQIDDYNLQISLLIDNGEYDIALLKADTLKTLSEKVNYTKGIAEAYNLKGVINRDKSNLKVALEYYLKALTLFQELKLPKRIAGMQNNIGLIYAEIKEYRTALAYYFKAEKTNKIENLDLAVIYNNIATCYQNLKQFNSAQTYLSKSLKIRKAINDSMGIAMAFHNIGVNHQLTNNHDSALNYFNKSLSFLGNENENIGHAYNYLEIGNTLLQNGDIKKAEPYLLKALKISQKNGLANITNSGYEYLYKLYSKKKDFKNAFYYQNLYLISLQTYENDDSKNELLKRELEYDFNKKRELQRIESENRQSVSDAEMQSQKKMNTYAIIALVVLSGLILFVFRSYNEKRKANFIISKQKEIVEHKQKEIVDSINYAKYIQNALLPNEQTIAKINSFILFKPKDIVSGDFYWIYEDKKNTINHIEIYVAVADCTGHGVPGALVSVLGNNGLNSCVKEFGITDTHLILDKLSEIVEETFEKSENQLKDGMDISLVKIIRSENSNKVNIQWSGANNPIWIIKQNKEWIEIKANKQPIGKYADKTPFIRHELELEKGDRIYLFTDGFADQFGGEKGKKYKYKQLSDLLISTINSDLIHQKNQLETSFSHWKGSLDQVDDICIIGIEV
jgi:serine phosphatase RsbU (regulator of sigma subunit)